MSDFLPDLIDLAASLLGGFFTAQQLTAVLNSFKDVTNTCFTKPNILALADFVGGFHGFDVEPNWADCLRIILHKFFEVDDEEIRDTEMRNFHSFMLHGAFANPVSFLPDHMRPYLVQYHLAYNNAKSGLVNVISDAASLVQQKEEILTELRPILGKRKRIDWQSMCALQSLPTNNPPQTLPINNTTNNNINFQNGNSDLLKSLNGATQSAANGTRKHHHQDELKKIIQTIRENFMRLKPYMDNLSSEDAQLLTTELKDVGAIFGSIEDILVCQRPPR